MWLTYAVSAAILWGLNYSLTERLVRSISPTTLLAFEMLIGAIGFFAISWFFDLKKDIAVIHTEPNLLFILIIEIIVVLSANLLIVYSIHAKDATVAGFVELIYPLFTILFTWLIFSENHVTLPVIIGGGLIMVGVYIISFA
jgi:drug/metabolite transporter (DMT)-like permease